MQTNRKIDLTAGLICVVLASLILFVAIPLGVQEPKKVKFVALSPSYYPRIVAYFLLCFGVLLIGLRYFSQPSESLGGKAGSWKKHIAPFVRVVVVLVLYYATLNYLGFVLSSVIALFTLLLIAGERKVWALITIPIVLPFALYYFFTHVANIPIPAGVLETLLVGA